MRTKVDGGKKKQLETNKGEREKEKGTLVKAASPCKKIRVCK